MSRTLLPKQLLTLNGEFSLLQQTVQRVLKVLAPERIWIVTNEEHVFEVRSQLKAIDERLDRQVLSEPMKRNTLPAIILGLDRIVEKDPEAIVAVFPSDHEIKDEAKWKDALALGRDLAANEYFVTFGVTPDGPETGYGYIEQGETLRPGAYKVQRFVEKPDMERAMEFVSSGRYSWNSGMFMFGAQAFMDAVRELQPEMYAWWEERAQKPLVQGYAGIRDESVDYGIMEQASRIAVVPADFGWDDLGNWEALHRLGDKDATGCVVSGDVLPLDCENSFLYSSGGKLAAIGVKNMVVVQTRDATLVCDKDQVQKVKDVVDILKKEESSLVEAHLTVYRPWGSYTILEEGPYYKIKRLEVLPGAKLSKQMHHHRSEHWVVVAGTALVEVDETEYLLTENQSIDIPKTSTHRLANPGRVPVEIIEIQTGPYLEEDDIVRFDDVYGRIKPGSGQEDF
jgi:mannose-1-phosphate guanylyltransferase/mannose-6-phosphate isomerase